MSFSVLTTSLFLKICLHLFCCSSVAGYDIFSYSTLFDESTFTQSLDNRSYSLVAILSEFTLGEKLKEYLNTVKQLSRLNDISLLHTTAGSHSELVPKFNLTYANTPLYLLFGPDKLQPLIYRGSWKSDDVIRWVISKTGLKFCLPGSIAAFDELVIEFREAKSNDRKLHLLASLRSLYQSNKYKDSPFAQFYIYITEKLMDHGEMFLIYEINRIKKLVDSEVSDRQKNILKKKLNIVTQFAKSKDQRTVKTEL